MLRTVLVIHQFRGRPLTEWLLISLKSRSKCFPGRGLIHQGRNFRTRPGCVCGVQFLSCLERFTKVCDPVSSVNRNDSENRNRMCGTCTSAGGTRLRGSSSGRFL